MEAEAPPPKPRHERVEAEDHVESFVQVGAPAPPAAPCKNKLGLSRACCVRSAKARHRRAAAPRTESPSGVLITPASLLAAPCPGPRSSACQARKRGQLNATFVAGAAAAAGYGDEDADVYTAAAAADAATGAAAAGYDSDDVGAPRRQPARRRGSVARCGKQLPGSLGCLFSCSGVGAACVHGSYSYPLPVRPCLFGAGVKKDIEVLAALEHEGMQYAGRRRGAVQCGCALQDLCLNSLVSQKLTITTPSFHSSTLPAFPRRVQQGLLRRVSRDRCPEPPGGGRLPPPAGRARERL